MSDSMFSSPSKQAQSASGQVQGNDAGMIQQYENYVSAQEGQLRGAIAAQNNPYFKAAKAMNPAGYALSPSDTMMFGSHGPGTTEVKSGIAGGGVPPGGPPGDGDKGPPKKMHGGPISRGAFNPPPVPVPVPGGPPHTVGGHLPL